MSARPNPEVPPPASPDEHGASPRVGAVHAPRREPAIPPRSATARLCLVDPAANTDEVVTAAVSLITTTYTAPGDRILLADTGTTPTTASRKRRDRLVESVLRLGRGASTTPDEQPPNDHESSAASGSLPGSPRSGSGLGPPSGDPAGPVANPTARQPDGEPASPGSDDVRLIIAGWSDHPADLVEVADYTPALSPSGTVVVLTHSSDQDKVQAGPSGQWTRAAALAGLTLTDRLILAQQPPSPPRPATRQNRRAIALGSHHRTHTTACVFRPSTTVPEVRHA